MFDIINLSFSIRCLCPLTIATVTLSSEEVWENAI